METTQPRKLIDGAEVNLGGEDYIIPPLNLKAVRRLMPKIDALSSNVDVSNLSDDMMDSVIEIIHTALLRNYPDMERAKVEEVVDLRNMREAIGAVLGTSGFEKKTGGQQSGEVVASQ